MESMKRFNLLFILILLFLFSPFCFGQTGSIIKLLEKGDYSQAFEKLQTAYKDTANAERYSLLYTYYSDKNNPDRNPFKAYYYAQQNNRSDNSEKIELETLSRQTLDEFYKSKDIDALKEYVLCFREETVYAKEAQRLLEQFAFEKVQQLNTIEAYEQYIKEYPQAVQSSLAKQSMDELIVSKVLDSDDLNVLEAFVATSDKQEYVAKAQEKIEKIIFTKALETNTSKAYADYLNRYPRGRYKKLVEERLDDVLYSQVMSSDMISDYMAFVNTYTEHPKYASVLDKLKRLTFQRLSMEGMQTLLTITQDSNMLNDFAKQYLKDTRKQTIDRFLSYFPYMKASTVVAKAEKDGKNIDKLLSKASITKEDARQNRTLFLQKDNLHSCKLLQKYIKQTIKNKTSLNLPENSVMRNFYQSDRLPVSFLAKEFPPARELKLKDSEVFSMYSKEGYDPCSEERNQDIYHTMTNFLQTTDTLLLPDNINSRYNEVNPLLTEDKKTIFFSSDNGVNHGGLDIYVSHRRDTNSWDNWSEPILLGSNINSDKDDVIIEIDGNELVVESDTTHNRKVFVMNERLEFTDGYLLNQNGDFLKGEIILLDSATLDTLFITATNDKGYFAYLKPSTPHIAYSHMENCISFFPEDNSQVTVQSIEELISSKKLYLIESPFSDKKPTEFTPEGKRQLEYFAKSIRQLNYMTTVSVHVHSGNKKTDKQELSDIQAEKISKLLIANGVNKTKIIVLGYGDTRPVIGWENKNRLEIGFLNR